MTAKPRYYLVEESALPEVFLKVAETKRLLSTGEASTVNEATRMTDISRSAFYKYRDAVMPFQNMMMGRIITFQLLLHDEAGLLSDILQVYAEANANIITIHSIVPTTGTAVAMADRVSCTVSASAAPDAAPDTVRNPVNAGSRAVSAHDTPLRIPVPIFFRLCPGAMASAAAAAMHPYSSGSSTFRITLISRFVKNTVATCCAPAVT